MNLVEPEELPMIRSADEPDLVGTLLLWLAYGKRHHAGGLDPVDPVYDCGNLHFYEREQGIWSPITRTEVSAEMQAWHGLEYGDPDDPRVLKISRQKIENVYRLACDRADRTGTDNRPGFFADARPGIAFADCFVGLDRSGTDLSVEDLAPELRARRRLEWSLSDAMAAYESDFNDSRFSGFLTEVFEGEEDAGAKVGLLQEFLGGALIGVSTRFQRALVVFGNGSNGKSVLLKVVQSLFPRGLVSSVPPQDFSSNFKKAALEGKTLNVVNELPEQDFLATQDFKALIDGNDYTGSHKFGQEHTIKARAAHVFSANLLPRVRDLSHGFWRRWLVVPFNRVFEPGERDPHLVQRIRSEEEALVATWLILGAERLLERGEYAVPAACQRALEEWRREANPVATFVQVCCTTVRSTCEKPTPTAVLSVAFNEFARETGHRPLSDAVFGRRLSQLGYESRQSRWGTNRPRCVDLWLKPEWQHAWHHPYVKRVVGTIPTSMSSASSAISDP
ncbi:MAG: phage/plasmid primase, P4 family [Myxococcota bacterium]